MDNKKFGCPYANIQSCSPGDDEINLLDIWNVLWKRRLLISSVIVLVTATAIVYAFLAPKTYETKINIAPPYDLSSDPAVNWLLSEISKITAASAMTPATVFDDAVEKIQDKTVLTQFAVLRERSSASSNKAEIRLLLNLRVKLSNKKRGEQLVSVFLTGGNPDTITELLNAYMSYVADYTERTAIDKLKSKLAERKLGITAKIEEVRNLAKEKIKQRTALLREQKAIAERLNIIKPSEPSETGVVSGALYAWGSERLQAEIDSLSRRKNIDLFIDSLPALQQQLQAIEMVDLRNIKISTMQADPAQIPKHPTKPKQQLIVALGMVLGLVLGVFAALLLNIVSNLRQRENLSE